MNTFLRLSAGIDVMNRWFGYAASLCVLVACLVSSGNEHAQRGRVAEPPVHDVDAGRQAQKGVHALA